MSSLDLYSLIYEVQSKKSNVLKVQHEISTQYHNSHLRKSVIPYFVAAHAKRSIVERF